jgi:ParB family chromosome partitioning protein
MATRRNALGRGLDALISGSSPAAATPLRKPREFAPAPEEDASVTIEVPLDRIDPNPEQPRRRFDSEAHQQLVESVRRHGILQPIVLRRAGERFELVVGERRWRAARAAELTSVPAVVADVAPQDRLELALVENVQRHDLNPIELALAFRTLVDAGATQEEVGRRVGIERSTVANHLRLLELPRELQEDVERGEIGVGHAKALLQVGNPERRRQLRDRIVSDQLSVRAAEEAARSAAGASRRTRRPRAANTLDPDTEGLLDSLRDRLQTRVRLVGTPARGRIEIEYFGPEDLNRVTSLILDPR